MNVNVSGSSPTSAANAYAGNLKKAMSSIASGTNASAAPSAVAISATLSSLISSGDTANSNNLDAVSMLQTSSSYLSSVSDNLESMQKLAVQAQSGTLSSDDLANVETQFKSLQDEISSTTSNYNASASFNGSALFQGNTYDVQTRAKQGQPTTISTPDLTSSSQEDIGTVDTYSYDSSNSVVGSSHTAVAWGSVINSVSGLDINGSDTVGALNKAIAYTSNLSAANSANIAGLSSSYGAVETYNANLNSAVSMSSDTDFAAESVALTRDMVMSQSQLAVQAQANSISDIAMKFALLKK